MFVGTNEGSDMGTSNKWAKDSLLADLEQSISKALDEKMVDLAGALYRLQGSAQAWCDDETCGECPLKPMQCVSRLEERVEELVEEHHAQTKTKTAPDDNAVRPKDVLVLGDRHLSYTLDKDGVIFTEDLSSEDAPDP